MQKKYQVFDNGRRADWTAFDHPTFLEFRKSWPIREFNSFEKAESYALKWLGDCSPGVGVLKPNVPYDYSGHGDYLEIKEIV